MASPNYSIRNQVIDLTTTKIMPVVDNLYKESLRAMLHLFGNIYYNDGNGNRTKVKCIHANPERMASRLVADNTMELPIISISEVSTSNSDERRRHSHVLISEKSWDPKTRRATRIVSLAPRPVNITYEINVWTKYKSDMDVIRSSIFNRFNPDIKVRTKFSDFSRAFLEEERDLGSLTANDTEDRVIQKSITVSLETYISSPKFRVTSTGEIDANVFEVTIGESFNDLNGVIEYPVDEGSDGSTEAPIGEIQESQRIDLAAALLALTLSGTFAGVAATMSLGNLTLETSALSLVLGGDLNLDNIGLQTSALSLLTEGGLNLDNIGLQTSAPPVLLDVSLGLDTVNLTLSALDLEYAASSNSQLNLGTLSLATSAPPMLLNGGLDLASLPVSCSLPDLHFTVALEAEDPSITLLAPNISLASDMSVETVSATLTVSGITLEATTNLSSVTLDTSLAHSITSDMSVEDLILVTSVIGTALDSQLNILIPLGASSSPDF